MKKLLILILVLGLTACGATTAQQRLDEIHKAEDAFCEFRAKEKAIESAPDASAPQAQEQTQTK